MISLIAGVEITFATQLSGIEGIPSPFLSVFGTPFLTGSFATCQSECNVKTIFTSTFINAILSSKLATDALDYSDITPSVFREYYCKYIASILKKFKVPSADFFAKLTVDPITDDCGALSQPIVMQVYANTIVEVLCNEGILNLDNAAILALAYFNELETSAIRLCKRNDLQSKMEAVLQSLLQLSEVS
ncbi:hypothetical protein CEXT_361431 [Caerostris extrusa]|uniref:Uncharacterized protein n=1 Tax=Caerostris extrusa TaxID=172846 RepID=A0AAV4PT65_CAEEX|nr:hypothetical protein CEXT_361431 [Caerostris extrusa]